MQLLARYPNAGRAGPSRSYLRLLRMGLAKPPCCHDAGGLLHHRFSFSLYALAQVGVFFSAALSVGSLRPAVSRHPALWSPDFPHACRRRQVARSFGPLSGVNFSTARPRRRTPYKKLSNTQPIGNKTPAFFCTFFCTFAHVGTLYLIAWNGSFTKSLR